MEMRIPPRPLLTEGDCFSPEKEGCEKIDLVLFHVIPAKAGIQVFSGSYELTGPRFSPG